MESKPYPVLENHPNRDTEKKLGCWAKFKSMFEDRGFDLEYEYNNTRAINIGNSNDTEGYRRFEDRRVSVDKTISNNTVAESTQRLDGELSGVNNFYEQFATLVDEPKDDTVDLWKRSSTVRHRVSMRPSMYLTNIAEETSSIGDADVDEIEVVS